MKTTMKTSMKTTMKAVNTFVALALLSAGIAGAHAAQEEMPMKGQADGQVTDNAVSAKTAAAPRGRLPRYFAALVTERQREEIYDIQRTHAVRRAELELELEELRKTEISEIEAVLNKTQRERLEELRAAALSMQGAARRSSSTRSAPKAAKSTEDSVNVQPPTEKNPTTKGGKDKEMANVKSASKTATRASQRASK
ncbi:MAG: hypothetical protein R3C53_23090 [Pirellulaceae bacterium]